MLFHNKCGGQLTFRVALPCDAIGFTLLKRKIRFTQCVLGSVEDVSFTLHCSACNTAVEIPDALVVCTRCGRTYSPADVYKITNGGGAYCDNCIAEIGQDRAVLRVSSIADLLSRKASISTEE